MTDRWREVDEPEYPRLVRVFARDRPRPRRGGGCAPEAFVKAHKTGLDYIEKLPGWAPRGRHTQGLRQEPVQLPLGGLHLAGTLLRAADRGREHSVHELRGGLGAEHLRELDGLVDHHTCRSVAGHAKLVERDA